MNRKLIMGICLVVILVLAAGCVEHRALSRVVSEERIISLDFGQSVHGSFLLGTGSINQITYYYYYRIEPDGSYTLQKAQTDYSKIYMDATVGNAKLIILNMSKDPYVCENEWSDAECKAVCDWYLYSWEKEYQFHVPVGTIIERYDANVRGMGY